MSKRFKRTKKVTRDSASVRYDYQHVESAVAVQSGDFFLHRSNMRGHDEEMYIALNETERQVTARRVILVPDALSPTGLKWSPTGLDCIFERAELKRVQLTNPASYATVRKVTSAMRSSHINDIRDNSKLVIHTDDNNHSTFEFVEHETQEIKRLTAVKRVRKPKARTCFECCVCTKVERDLSLKHVLSGVCKKQVPSNSVR